MSKLQELEDLRSQLFQAGWRVQEEVPSFGDGASWYAFERLDGLPHCECNEKPPSLIVFPYYFRDRSDGEHASVKFSITGEAGGQWFELQLYSVPVDRAIETIEPARKQLSAAWAALFQSEG